jgi:hypothetical protein
MAGAFLAIGLHANARRGDSRTAPGTPGKLKPNAVAAGEFRRSLGGPVQVMEKTVRGYRISGDALRQGERSDEKGQRADLENFGKGLPKSLHPVIVFPQKNMPLCSARSDLLRGGAADARPG